MNTFKFEDIKFINKDYTSSPSQCLTTDIYTDLTNTESNLKFNINVKNYTSKYVYDKNSIYLPIYRTYDILFNINAIEPNNNITKMELYSGYYIKYADIHFNEDITYPLYNRHYDRVYIKITFKDIHCIPLLLQISYTYGLLTNFYRKSRIEFPNKYINPDPEEMVNYNTKMHVSVIINNEIDHFYLFILPHNAINKIYELVGDADIAVNINNKTHIVLDKNITHQIPNIANYTNIYIISTKPFELMIESTFDYILQPLYDIGNKKYKLFQQDYLIEHNESLDNVKIENII